MCWAMITANNLQGLASSAVVPAPGEALEATTHPGPAADLPLRVQEAVTTLMDGAANPTDEELRAGDWTSRSAEPDAVVAALSAPEGGAVAPYEDRDGTLWIAIGQRVCRASSSVVRRGEIPRWQCDELPGIGHPWQLWQTC